MSKAPTVIQPDWLCKKLRPGLEECFGNFLILMLIPNKKGLLFPLAYTNLSPEHRRLLWKLLKAELEQELPAGLPETLPVELRSVIPDTAAELINQSIYPTVHKHCRLAVIASFQLPPESQEKESDAEERHPARLPDKLPEGTSLIYLASGQALNLQKMIRWYSKHLQESPEGPAHEQLSDNGTDPVPTT